MILDTDKGTNEYDTDEPKMGYNGYFFELDEEEDEDEWYKLGRHSGSIYNMDCSFYISNFTFWQNIGDNYESIQRIISSNISICFC